LIENGEINSPEMNSLLHQYLKPMVEANIDYLVLGCSHYPYLIPQIKKILPKRIKIIDSGEAVARQTKKVLEENNALNLSSKKGEKIFYTNSDSNVLKTILNGNQHEVIEKDF
jgi:glutamate racemase